MTTIIFSDAASNPDLVADFDPLTDVLAFTDIVASDVKVTIGENSVTFTVDDRSVTLDIDIRTLDSGSDGNIRFIDGSVLAVGDNSTATVADDLSNVIYGTDEGDQLIGVCLTRAGDEVVLSTRNGMAIRFSEANARPMGRATYGVKGINLVGDDEVVGMTVADPDGCLLTVCEFGYGKRTPFGANTQGGAEAAEDENGAEPEPTETEEAEGGEAEGGEADRSSMRYRLQRRGGKGVRDVKVTAKNGRVVGVASVRDGDEVILITVQGMVTRCKVDTIRLVGRNTQGVRVMNLNDGDRLATLAKVAPETVDELVEGERPA